MHEPEETPADPAYIAAGVPANPADTGATPRYLPGQLTLPVHEEPEAIAQIGVYDVRKARYTEFRYRPAAGSCQQGARCR